MQLTLVDLGQARNEITAKNINVPNLIYNFYCTVNDMIMAYASEKLLAAPSTVFLNSIAMVIGPTPPGTGVMKEAFSEASAKFTSPTNL